MTTRISDATRGFIEVLEDISHDPDEYDDFDLREYVENLPNPYKVLMEFGLHVHGEYL